MKLIFDKDTDPNQLGTLIEQDIPALTDGYLHCDACPARSRRVSNTGLEPISYDNFMVTYLRGKTRQINHYYPYGLSISSLSYSDEYLNKYTAKELQTGEFGNLALSSGLEMFDFGSRFYDPALGRWFTPDPEEQFANPYLAMGCNPVKYVDPDGEFIFTALALIAAPFTGGASLALLPYTIGADLGAWQGGTIANGTANPFKWDYSSGKTWSYMAGGAVVGAASGGAANAVATSGMAFANTAAIATGSFANSVGMNIVSGGQTDVSIGFGFGSYNFDTGEFGYLGKKGNSTMENIGYSIGALVNISDGVELFDQIRANNHNNLTNAQKQTQYENNYQEGWYDEYIGPNGNADPVVARANGHVPTTPLGEAGYQHDIAYYNQGADGVRGAVFNTKTLAADRMLLSSAKSIRQAYRSGSNISLKTHRMALGVRIVFLPLVGFKYALSNAYLFSPYTIAQ